MIMGQLKVLQHIFNVQREKSQKGAGTIQVPQEELKFMKISKKSSR